MHNTIAVIGATGAQGGGLVRAILNQQKDGGDSCFKVRAITRNPLSEKAQELQRLGAEVVKGDINNEKSLIKAISGCYGLFCVTLSSADDYTPEQEIWQATVMSRAARKTDIKHVVWSTIEDTRLKVPIDSPLMPTLNFRFKVPHFDAKGESDSMFADLPTTYMMTSLSWETFIVLGMKSKGMANKFYLSLPIGLSHIAGISFEDVGKCALGIFNQPDEYIDRRIGIVGEKLTLNQIAKKLSIAMGREVFAYPVDCEEYRQLQFEGADDFVNMFKYLQLFESDFCNARSVEESRILNPELMDFDAWLAKHKEIILNNGD